MTNEIANHDLVETEFKEIIYELKPVLDKNGALAGLIGERHIIKATAGIKGSFDLPVSAAMDYTPPTVPLATSPAEVVEILKEGTAVMVNDKDGFHGLITRVDMINYISRS